MKQDFQAGEVAPAGGSQAAWTSASPAWARSILSAGQKRGWGLAVLAALMGGVFFPAETAIAAVAVIATLHVGHMAFRSAVWLAGLAPWREFPVCGDETLPIYSVIVPMYDEANIVASCLQAMARLDYPADRLDVIFALEADDHLTRAAFARQDMPSWARIALASDAPPRTKPKACNEALRVARGEFVVVYDAEDRPEPDQLRRAVAAFRGYGPDVACLQARLAPYNRRDNFLTRMFALDYCLWFDFTLAGLHRLGFPVPLGGTSNHFRRAALVAAGAWDPWNVTEDADLGVRLGRLGLGVRTISSTTFEEAPVAMPVWVPQRTRWIKGYFQTFLVHSRFARTSGLPPLSARGWALLILFVGGSAVFALVNPVFWAMAAYGISGGGLPLDWAFGPVAGPLAFVSMTVGNILALIMALAAPVRRGWWDLIPWAVATPVYWAMVSAAAYRAVLGLITDPFGWEKTPHGLTRTRAPE